MAELENVIENFMSSPENMNKIMEVVKMLGVGDEKTEKATVKETPSIPFPSIGEQSQNLESAMLSKIMGLLGDYNADGDRRISLLRAIRPYLRGEDSFHIDRAIQIVKLSRVAKSVFRDFLK